MLAARDLQVELFYFTESAGINQVWMQDGGGQSSLFLIKLSLSCLESVSRIILCCRLKREARKRERKERVTKNLTVNGTWLHPQQRARPGPAPDNALLLPSATAQNVTGKQNRTGSYKLVADGATSVSRLLTSSGFGTVLVITTKTDA